ncbi:MAG TPA: aromatic ring-opening dioxygenase LigA [Propioniciclava sp.]|jgi:hypothetical protein|uniref:aromatic ring-opening dioxygenase LigA n=1 Tax=Propioniciclava sp. TaxID=2038686 RepID=UPI002CFCCA7D|nr:aromatic ring-opening dioxygenase LigA [Propioniciclava sp.]HRL49961.1 aromatic ring-opening dioxygenase LigA [Propioniciclava sp.]HRL80622.1 aromatic ring-opening dioxygenase LigA [Propioniciclava sp.]
MNVKPLKVAGLVSIIIGILFTLTGGVVWGVVSSQLAAEKITVPNDAKFLQGALVSGPLSALAQADIISTHALKASGGLTYSELGAAATAAKNAGETAKAEDLTAQRATVMNGSFLRASLFTSVLSFGVCLFAIGVGVSLLVIGWALNKVGSQKVAAVVAETPAA